MMAVVLLLLVLLLEEVELDLVAGEHPLECVLFQSEPGSKQQLLVVLHPS